MLEKFGEGVQFAAMLSSLGLFVGLMVFGLCALVRKVAGVLFEWETIAFDTPDGVPVDANDEVG